MAYNVKDYKQFLMDENKRSVLEYGFNEEDKLRADWFYPMVYLSIYQKQVNDDKFDIYFFLSSEEKREPIIVKSEINKTKKEYLRFIKSELNALPDYLIKKIDKNYSRIKHKKDKTAEKIIKDIDKLLDKKKIRQYYVSRLIMCLDKNINSYEIHHKDGNTLNNKFSNLYVVDPGIHESHHQHDKKHKYFEKDKEFESIKDNKDKKYSEMKMLYIKQFISKKEIDKNMTQKAYCKEMNIDRTRFNKDFKEYNKNDEIFIKKPKNILNNNSYPDKVVFKIIKKFYTGQFNDVEKFRDKKVSYKVKRKRAKQLSICHQKFLKFSNKYN